MRKLMWFAIGFAASCGICVYVIPAQQQALPAVFALGAALLAGIFHRRWDCLGLAAIIFLTGVGSGLFWYQGFYQWQLAPAAALDGVTQEAAITATDYSFETGYGLGVDGTMVLGGKSYQVRAFLEVEETIEPGTVIKGSFRFRMTTPDSLQGVTSHSGKGIFLLAYQKGEPVFSDSGTTTFSMCASRLRRQIETILHQCVPEDVSAFAKALLLGDPTDLSYAVDTQLKVSGIRHVAAVSGMHVSILFALLTGLTLRKRFATAALGFPALFVFAAVAGFTPSVNRACLMCGLMLVAMLLNREYDGATALSFAGLIMLLLNPLTISSVSFQLSVTSAAGIFAFSASLRQWFVELLGEEKRKGMAAWLKRWLSFSAATTLSAVSLTAPLSAWYFGNVSLIGVVTNLLTLWVISVVFYGLIGVCLLFLVSPSAAAVLGSFVTWPIRYVLLTAKVLAGFPLACVYTASAYVVVWLVFVYLLLAVFLLSRKRRPMQLFCFAGLGLCLSLLLSWTEPALYATSMTVLDVGQGQCIVLQSEGKTFLVDCGGDSDTQTADTAAAWLLSRGISRLDGLILTHMDRDHAGGAGNLLTRIPADVVILPPVRSELETINPQTIYADREVNLRWGNTSLTVFGEKIPEYGNENSLCILLDTEKCDILITGDRNREGEIRLLQSGKIGKMDVLVAGHHGSRNSTSEELLEAVRPGIVCISAGADNLYGHPAKETLLRLQQYGCTVCRTDVHGTITIRR